LKTHLLDTGIISAYLLNRPRIVALVEPLIIQALAATSMLVYGEIDEYHQSKADYAQRKQILRLLLRRVTPYAPNYAIMERYATIGRVLRAPHGPGIIGDIDTIIAATAMHYRLTLITADSDFARVASLQVFHTDRSWLKA
jgi:predicted nucleic acid-binding protein